MGNVAEGADSGFRREESPLWPGFLRDALPPVAADAGTARFAVRLIDLLAQVLKFDWWMVMVYCRHANPEMLGENFSGSWREQGLTTYIGSWCLLDPFSLVGLSLDHPKPTGSVTSLRTALSTANITAPTAKVHRENISGRRGVSSQAELFNMFTASVSPAPSASR